MFLPPVRSLFLSAIIIMRLGELYSQTLVINEINASNQNGLYDDFFEFDDWVEIHNGGGITNLAGYYLSDDLDSLDKWMFPVSNPGITTILPGGHVLIWCDKDPEQGEDHADFKLSGEGETVFLVEPDGSTIVDSITYGLQQEDISFGRSCDGCLDWTYFNVPTPDAPNNDTQLPAAVLYINEFQNENQNTLFDEQGDFDAWVEIFNPNDFQVNLAGYSFTLNGAESIVTANQPWLTTVGADGFIVFWLDGDSDAGGNHLAIQPDAGNVELTLLAQDGSAVNSLSWNGALEVDFSYGRELDGSPNWIAFESPTPRVTNALQIIPSAPIVLNEVMNNNGSVFSDEASEWEDWVEVHNHGQVAVDIAGYYFTDRLDAPQKWMVPIGIPDSTVIEPGGFMVLFADEDSEQGWNHMNFKLNGMGEHLALRTPDGFTVSDSLWVPALEVDLSWGRAYDNQLPWVVFEAPTPDASNGTTEIFGNLANPAFSAPYPNPVSENSQVHFSMAGSLFSLAGQPCSKWGSAGWVELNQAAGIYIVVFESGHGQPLIIIK